MDITRICTWCMSGVLENGVCSCCGKAAAEGAKRPRMALPERHLLCSGRYCLGRVLGLGGYGITYLARDRQLERRVAVKEFYPKYLLARQYPDVYVSVGSGQSSEFQHAKMRFEQEARILYELRDIPEVIDVYHLFEENGTAYYAMEYLEGTDMKTYLLGNGVQQWQRMKKPLRMLLKALYHVHEKGLIHRDVSPDNIFMLPDGGAKLIDFGNARGYTAQEPLTMILKTRFAPIEQYLDGRGQGPWTDIYSLSVTAYYAMSGKLPAASQDRLIAMERGRDPVAPLASLNPDIPRHISDAIGRGMAVDPQNRYQTVPEFWDALFPGEALAAKRGSCLLCCTRGILAGTSRELAPGEVVSLGRGRDSSIRYPADSRGISRSQCSVVMGQREDAYVRDDHSSYGTTLDGKRLIPMRWYQVGRGGRIRFAGEEYQICKEREKR